jgi:hypothetical protein
VAETVEMLLLDAVENPPTVWVVLTAREHLTRRDTYRHLEQLRRAARRRWPGLEWFVEVEFQMRGALHLNLLVKGVPPTAAEELRQVLGQVWCSRVDALMTGQWSDSIDTGEAAVLYITKQLAHGLKLEQAPPIGWKGHRTSQTRGYFVRPASVMRQEAKAARRLKRRLWKSERLAWDRAEVEVERAGHEADSSQAAYLRGFLEAEGFVDEWQAEHLAELEEADGLRSWELVAEKRCVLPEGGSVVTGYRAVRGGGGPRRAGSPRRAAPDPVEIAAVGGYTGPRGVEIEGSDGRSLRVPILATLDRGEISAGRGSGGEPPGVPAVLAGCATGSGVSERGGLDREAAEPRIVSRRSAVDRPI